VWTQTAASFRRARHRAVEALRRPGGGRCAQRVSRYSIASTRSASASGGAMSAALR
jgi:hypothetical protein